MKLRNKKTGKIGYLYEHSLAQDIIIVYDVKGIVGKYKSITELCEEWEDAPEEPKEYWYIADNGEIEKDTDDGGDYEEKMKKIGNYFEIEEEAENAVEKLKAWKWLKDKGFRFTGVEDVERTIHFEIPFRAGYGSCEAEVNLEFLFGGKE
jgi:hypothetical protein